VNQSTWQLDSKPATEDYQQALTAQLDQHTTYDKQQSVNVNTSYSVRNTS